MKKCNRCGVEGNFVHIHHIDGNKNNNLSENLEDICFNCHLPHHWLNPIKRKPNPPKVVIDTEFLLDEIDFLKEKLREAELEVKSWEKSYYQQVKTSQKLITPCNKHKLTMAEVVDTLPILDFIVEENPIL